MDATEAALLEDWVGRFEMWPMFNAFLMLSWTLPSTGYDPCELFFDPESRSIPADPSLVKGSHGLPADGRKEAQAVMICSDPALDDYTPPDLKATQFLGMLYRVI